MQEEKLEGLREGIRSVDQSRPPVKVISGYSILDHLGTGAFGSVFKVQKHLFILPLISFVSFSNIYFDVRSKSRAARTSWL